ncbi:MAG: hypothetical protein ACFFDW_06520 [Candidatus Thorarchaeota archaeon]
MTIHKEIICSVCAEIVPESKFCSKCGAPLNISLKEELEIQKKRFNEILKRMTDFENTILKSLQDEYHQKFIEIKINIEKLINKITSNEKRLSFEEKGETSPTTLCLKCGREVPHTQFCQHCGNFLGEFLEESDRQFIECCINTQALVLGFKRMAERILAPIALEDINFMYNNMRQIVKTNAKRLEYNKAKATETKVSELDVTKKDKEITKGWKEVYSSIGVLGEEKKPSIRTAEPVSSTPITPTTPKVKTAPITTVKIPPKESKPVAERKTPVEKEPTLYSKFERYLLDYWFFYLGTFFLSAGISVTLYFVSVEMESKISQVVIINSIGVAIIALSQTYKFIMNRREKKRIAELGPEKAKKKQKRDIIRYTPTMPTVFMFIGYIVLFVGGLVGMYSYESLGVSKGLFVGLNLGICAVLMAISILNNSEFLSLTSIMQAIVFTTIDLLWTQYPPVLNSITSFIVFLLIIISSTFVGIFSKKWTVPGFTMALVPSLICIPTMYSQIGLEFILIALIPLMIILTIQFGSAKVPMPIKRSLVVMSFLIPLISIFVIILTNTLQPTTEATWAAYHSYQTLIIGLAFLGVSYYYQFIQEKHLDIKTSNELIWFAGQAFTGMISFLSIATDQDTLITSIFFGIFFVFGVLSTIKYLRERLSIANVITSFSMCEILAILIMIFVDVNTLTDNILIFILGISFSLLATISLFISKVFHWHNVLYLIWNGIAWINLLIIGLLDMIEPWFIFASLIVFLVGSLIVNIPIIIPKITFWREFSIFTLFINGAISLTLLLTGKFAFFSYAPLVIFSIIAVTTIPGFIPWKQKEVVINE